MEKKSILKITRNKKNKNLNLKINAGEKKLMQQNADKYFGGNLSGWMRYSAMYLKPKQKDLVDYVD